MCPSAIRGGEVILLAERSTPTRLVTGAPREEKVQKLAKHAVLEINHEMTCTAMTMQK